MTAVVGGGDCREVVEGTDLQLAGEEVQESPCTAQRLQSPILLGISKLLRD